MLLACLSFEDENRSIYHQTYVVSWLHEHPSSIIRISAGIMPKNKASKEYNVEEYTNLIQAWSLYSEEAIAGMHFLLIFMF